MVFSSIQVVNFVARTESKILYLHMQSGGRDCIIIVTVFHPLTKSQVNKLNDQKYGVANIVGSGVTAVVGMLNKVVAFPAGVISRKYMLNKIRAYHLGDVLVSITAEVSGGIGPQKSMKSIVIKQENHHIRR